MGTFRPGVRELVETDQSCECCWVYLVEARSQQSRDLLDQSVGSQESVVLSCQLLHLLLVLVEFLEVVSRHGGDAGSLGLVNVLLISQKTNFIFQFWNMLKPKKYLRH